MPQALSNVLGFPRIGPQRELKSATESYWSGDRSMEDLLGTAKELRAANWKLQRDAGIDLIPSNDFSLYDQVLDTVAMVGAVPARYDWDGSSDIDLDTYFAMARGRQTGGVDVTAMEMTKWFDTNYHYIVPELERGMKFRFSSRKPLEHYAEAKELGIQTKPVLVGPADLPAAGQVAPARSSTTSSCSTTSSTCTPRCWPSSASSARSGCSSTSRCWSRTARPAELEALERAYKKLAAVEGAPKIVIATYFDHVGDAYPVLTRLPVAGVSLDFVYGPQNRELVAQARLARGQDPVRGRRERPQRVDQRPRREPRPDRRAAQARGRQRRGLDVQLAAALAGRQDQRAAPRRRGAELDVVRRAEARRGGGADARDQRGPRCDLRRSSTRTRRRSRTGATRRARATRRCASASRR